MKRRICESCLYFESAGFAKNGWCHHPSRRQNSDVRLIVRSNELGCRNGWNADLWVPASVEGADQRSQPLEGIGGRAASEVGPAEQNDLITSIVAAKTENVLLPESRPTAPAPASQPYVEEDIFVNQTPSLTWNAPSSGPISAQPATELVQNPKAAILRARDQFRQRRKNEGRIADQRLSEPTSTFLASSREARLLHEHDLVQPEPDPESVDPRYENRPLIRAPFSPNYNEGRPVSPVKIQEIDRPFPSMTEFPEDRARFESVPRFESEIVEDEVIDVLQDDTWIETRQIDAVLPEPYVVDDFFEEEEIVAPSDQLAYEDDDLSVQHRESILNRFLRQRRERREYPEYVDEPNHANPERYVLNAGEIRPEPSPAMEIPDPFPEPYREVERPIAAAPVLPPPPAPVASSPTDDSYEIELPREAPRARLEQRAEPRMAPAPPSWEEDDFIIPPPLPEYQPTHDQQTQSFETRRRPRVEPKQAESRTRSIPIEPPVADEFGDQPLFASQPLSVTEDVALDGPYIRNERAVPVSARVERVCQTCRDFRPAENGERGWCNNKWAFNHRRMVDADDLACRNSLGSWWTPKDESWRRDGDISRHAQQTPRVDQWLLGTPANDTDRRRSGS